MDNIDAGGAFEQLNGQMRRRAYAGGAVIEFARLRLGEGDQFGYGTHR